MLLALLVPAGCHGNHANVAPSPGSGAIAIAPATTLDKIWLLESSGAAVADTSITFAAAAGRTVVLRHARPDNAIFLILDFPPSTDSTMVRDSIHLRVEPMAGKYGFTISTPDKLGARVQATFSYAIHFRSPPEANQKYATAGAVEQALAPAQLAAANKVQFIGGMRPAADVIRFSISGPGSYALVVPR